LQLRQYSLHDFARLEKNPLRENCRAPVGEEFSMNFVAADAALLTQGKENK
jgi:hypothetical protein